jgi:hypothetical protein
MTVPMSSPKDGLTLQALWDLVTPAPEKQALDLAEQAYKRALEWRGTPSELLRALNALVEPSTRTARDWPASPQNMGNWLKRKVPVLREAGFNIVRTHSEQRLIAITRKH